MSDSGERLSRSDGFGDFTLSLPTKVLIVCGLVLVFVLGECEWSRTPT